MVISALTNAEDNPQGFLVLSVAMAVVGVLMIPLPGYFQRRLGKICRGTAAIGTFFYLLGIVGLIAVGVLYEGLGLPNRLHETLAAVAFAGLVFGNFFYGWPMIKDRLAKYHGKRQFNGKLMGIGFTLLWIAFLGMAGSALYLEITPNEWGWVGLDWIGTGAPVLASFAVWEWT